MVSVLRYHSNGHRIALSREEPWLVQMSNKCKAWESPLNWPAGHRPTPTVKGQIAPSNPWDSLDERGQHNCWGHWVHSARWQKSHNSSRCVLNQNGAGLHKNGVSFSVIFAQSLFPVRKIRVTASPNSSVTAFKRYTILIPSLNSLSYWFFLPTLSLESEFPVQV